MMSEAGASAQSPVIGTRAAPPFARLPDPSTLFRARAQRFAMLALESDLAPYLRFMAGLAEAQHRAQEGLPAPALSGVEELDRARQFAMPPLDRARCLTDGALEATFDRLFALASEIDMPAAARDALARARALDGVGCAQLRESVVAAQLPDERLGEATFVAAALQAHFARLASRLDPGRLQPIGEGACPACGSAPVASMVVGWPGAEGTRFCACSLCATLWHVVRIKCVSCGSTEGVAYREMVEGPGAGKVRAETCSICRGYVKIMLQHLDSALDPVADDVATVGLDLLMRDTVFRRAAVNPYLIGY